MTEEQITMLQEVKDDTDGIGAMLLDGYFNALIARVLPELETLGMVEFSNYGDCVTITPKGRDALPKTLGELGYEGGME